MALWTPAEITTALWLDASDSSTITLDSGVVAQWADKSGNSRHATQGTASLRPAVVDNEIVFESDQLVVPTSAALFEGYTICIVGSSTATGGTSAGLINILSSPLNDPEFRFGKGNDIAHYYNGGYVINGDYGCQTKGIFCFEHTTGLKAELFKNGTSVVSATRSGVLSTINHFDIGYFNNGEFSGYRNGNLCELIVFPNNTDNRQKIEGYLAWKWGLEATLPSGHPYEGAAPTLLPTNILVRAIIDQVYGLRLLQIFNQPYGDAARLRRKLDQPYSDAARLRRKLDQLYGDSPRYRAALEQICNLQVGLRATCAQPYTIAEGQIRAAFAQLYNLQDKDLIRAILDMLYVLAAGEALVQRFDIEVTCDGIAHSSMGNINLEQDDQSFYMVGELQLYSRTEAVAYKKFSSSVVITVNAAEYYFISGMVSESRQPGQDVFVVPLYSPTILLQGPYSRLAAGELSGMAADLVAALAAPFTTSWQLVNWFIPPGRLVVSDGQAAIDIIRRITEAVGGIVQTSPAGVLVCRPEYPISVNQWAHVTPDYYLTDQDDFFQIEHSPEQNDGYNKFNVSDNQLTTGGLTMEATTISATVSEERVYMLPWDDTKGVRLHHSGNPSRVSIVADGIEHQEMPDEQIEIVGGSGSTSKPFYTLISYRYGEADLGSLTIAEDGTITTAIAENSILYISYLSRNWKFTVTDNTVEDVQFFPEEYTI